MVHNSMNEWMVTNNKSTHCGQGSIPGLRYMVGIAFGLDG